MSNSDAPCSSPHELVTEDYIKKVLEADAGKDAQLVSWQIKDFTHRGDNYCSFVTSIMIEARVDGKITEKSYIAKLNPLRPISDVTKMVDDMFKKEVTVLSQVLRGLNSSLMSLSLPPLRVPRFHAANLAPRMEAIYMEDLRRKGFQMFSRQKGLDTKHATLVMEELGRFHAASLLYQDTLTNKSILDAHPEVVEPFDDFKNPVFKVFECMILSQIEGTRKLLQSLNKYTKCVQWMEKHKNGHARRYVEFIISKRNNVFTHGDCWTNNIVFRYDENGDPIELHLVDLQVCRMAPASLDLNYFLYSSLTGETRRKNWRLFLASYYTSFLKVFLAAGRKPPFTFEELEKDVEATKLFGIYTATLILPLILSEAEDVVDILQINEDTKEEIIGELNEKFTAMASRGGTVFEERFLAVFDEMMELNLFDD